MTSRSTLSKKTSDYLKVFNAAADELEPRFRSNWSRALNQWRNDPTMTKAMRDLVAGRITPVSFATRVGTVLETLPQSLRSGLNVVQLRGLNIQNNIMGVDKIKNAGEWAERYGAERIYGITNASRDAINSFVSGAITEGMPVSELASHIGDVLGTDQRFARAALNYRNSMLAVGTKPARVQTLTRDYVRRAASQRAKTIARTETMSALAYGQRTALSVASSTGLLAADARMVWIAAPGCCDRCTKLNGVTTGINGVWTIEGMQFDSPPMHPNCRCVIGVE